MRRSSCEYLYHRFLVQPKLTLVIHSQFREIVKWVWTGSPTSFEEIIQLRGYVNAIVESTPKLPNIMWMDGKHDTLLVEGIRLPLDGLRDTISDTVLEVEATLAKLLLGFVDVPQHQGDSRDQLANHTPGYSFIHDQLNGFSKNSWWLIESLLQDETLTSEYSSLRTCTSNLADGHRHDSEIHHNSKEARSAMEHVSGAGVPQPQPSLLVVLGTSDPPQLRRTGKRL